MVYQNCDKMGLPHGSVVRIVKGAYGLTIAPRQWFEAVKKKLVEIGFIQCKIEPCCFRYVVNEVLHGLVLFHVDDFLISGNPNSKYWTAVKSELKESWSWGAWERDKFKICGIEIEQHSDFSFTVGQSKYIADIEPIPITPKRTKERTSPVTEYERSQLRGINGALQWFATQSGPKVMAALSMSQSLVTKATVQELVDANKLLQQVKLDKHLDIHIKGIVGRPGVAIWGDAAWANRPDGSSTGGTLIGITDIDSLLKGGLTFVNMVSWKSHKLKRKSRSPTASEVQAVSDAEDEGFFVRLMWLSFNGYDVSRDNRKQSLRDVPCVVVTDSKSLYDAYRSQTGGLGMEEKRTALELVDLKERIGSDPDVTLRWVNSEANLADSLTKPHARRPLEQFYETGFYWAITRDPLERSAKKRREQGLTPLTPTNDTVTSTDGTASSVAHRTVAKGTLTQPKPQHHVEPVLSSELNSDSDYDAVVYGTT